MKPALAIGFFDGVHIGHRALLDNAEAALTFSNHPLSVLAPDRLPKLILSQSERYAAIRACGVRRLTVLDFTAEMSAMSPEDFAASFLGPELSRLGEGAVVRCGGNWHFGKGGTGDAALLAKLGYPVEVVPSSCCRGEMVSSSRIRAALAAGDLALAAEMLGRSYRLRGVVVPGKGLGRRLGFPTVNVKLANECPPLACGAYAVQVDGLRGVANFGFAPTLGDQAWKTPTLEINFLSTPPAMDEVEVEFAAFLRPERKFSSIDELKAQIARDRDVITNFLPHVIATRENFR